MANRSTPPLLNMWEIGLPTPIIPPSHSCLRCLQWMSCVV